MFRNLQFYIYKTTIEVNGGIYPLGKLTTSLLNITPGNFHEMTARMEQVRTKKAASYPIGGS